MSEQDEYIASPVGKPNRLKCSITTNIYSATSFRAMKDPDGERSMASDLFVSKSQRSSRFSSLARRVPSFENNQLKLCSQAAIDSRDANVHLKPVPVKPERLSLKTRVLNQLKRMFV
jgi:hypothetical protein